MGDEAVTDSRGDQARRDRLDTFITRSTRYFRCMFVILFIGGFVSGYLITQNRVRANDAADLARSIQKQRIDSIRTACRETNRRNRVAYVFLKALPPQPGEVQRSPAEQERLLHGFTDALVGPVRDCEARVRQLTR